MDGTDAPPSTASRLSSFIRRFGRLALHRSFPTVEEWNLRSEPWIFVVDGEGMIRAKFEGLTTRRELEVAVTTSG
jgi:hypothetical protein